MTTHRRAPSLTAALVLALSSLALQPISPVMAADGATIDCTNAVNAATGEVGARPPVAGDAWPSYFSTYQYKFDGGFAGTGYDWRDVTYWIYGDSDQLWIWEKGSSTTWTPLASAAWVVHDYWNTGTVSIRERQWYWQTRQDLLRDVGSCETYQFTVFYPFGG